jgi:hypothetical protein
MGRGMCSRQSDRRRERRAQDQLLGGLNPGKLGGGSKCECECELSSVRAQREHSLTRSPNGLFASCVQCCDQLSRIPHELVENLIGHREAHINNLLVAVPPLRLRAAEMGKQYLLDVVFRRRHCREPLELGDHVVQYPAVSRAVRCHAPPPLAEGA